MDFNINVRKKQMQSLNQYILSSKENVQLILNTLEWSSRKTLENTDTKIKCPLNTNHTVPDRKIDAHVRKCSLVHAGYDSKDIFLSEPLNHPTLSVNLDTQQQMEIFTQARKANPKFRAAWNGNTPSTLTSDRYVAIYSPDERLALYNYCLKVTEGPPVPKDICLISDGKKNEGENLTYEQSLAKLRDAKRRRTKYKSVHSKHRTYTEEIREVISSQMELYKDFIASQNFNEDQQSEDLHSNERCADYQEAAGTVMDSTNFYSNVPDYLSDVEASEPSEEQDLINADLSNRSGSHYNSLSEYDRKVQEFLDRLKRNSK